MLQLKSNTKLLREINCETAKVIKDDLQNNWKQRAV